MELIVRQFADLDQYIRDKYVLSIFGPRRTGKTTLVNSFLATKEKQYKILKVVGDDIVARNILSSESLQTLLDWSEGYDYIFIDEAQKVPRIGVALKMLIDSRPGIKIIVTGSSSFELLNEIGAPLTGRMTSLTLFPISTSELFSHFNEFEVTQAVTDYMIYGMYPEIRTLTNNSNKVDVLNSITSGYLFKDILEIDKVKNAKLLLDLLTLVAYQVGGEVSHNDLANKLGISKNTVVRYLDLFEKNYILYNLRGYSRNLRSEVTKKSKYYFYDNGIRNAIIGDFNSINVRSDQGALWENFMIIERLKFRNYSANPARDYFWRTWEQNEIDLLEEAGSNLVGYEFKYSNAKTVKLPARFVKAYGKIEFNTVNRENFVSFIR